MLMMMMVNKVIQFKPYMKLSKELPQILQHEANRHGEPLRVTHYDDEEDDEYD